MFRNTLRCELHAWVRVVDQSIAKAGEQGTECPMTIWLTYKQKSPSDTEQNRYFCIYVDETAADLPKDQKGSEFIYTPVHQSQWYHLKYELRNYESLKDAYYLQSVTIYAQWARLPLGDHRYFAACHATTLAARSKD